MTNVHCNTKLRRFEDKHSTINKRRAVTLLAIQLAAFSFLIISLVLICFASDVESQFFYIPIMGVLTIAIGISIALNLKGKYGIAAWMISISIIVAPWISILFDPAVLKGDLMPVLYVGVSVQLCSLLLSERALILIAVTEMAAVLTIFLSRPNATVVNWQSLFAFILFSLALAISYGYLNKKQLEEIRDLSIRDSLTGLFNRRYMEETFLREIDRVIRKNQQLAVIMVDIDGFKVINDTYGHIIGDNVLIRIADLLAKSIRSSDIACRFGGDEFVLIMPECSNEEATIRAESIRMSISQSIFNLEGATIQDITISFGIAELPSNGLTRDELISAADKALYLAKKERKNHTN